MQRLQDSPSEDHETGHIATTSFHLPSYAGVASFPCILDNRHLSGISIAGDMCVYKHHGPFSLVLYLPRDLEEVTLLQHRPAQQPAGSK